MKKLVITEYVFPPIPDRSHDWSARFAWFDGDDIQPTGTGETEEMAVVDLIAEAIGDGDCDDVVIELAMRGWRAENETGAQRVRPADPVP